MGLLGTLGKVAMGIAVAKGAGSLLGKSNNQSSGGLGDILGGLIGGNTNTSTNSGQTSGSTGGLGDILGSLISSVQNPNSNTNDEGSTSSGLSDILSSAFAGATKDDEDEKAKILLRAMISAAKADGHVDAQEQEKITKYLGDITPDEVEFVTNELNSPLDVEALVADVPDGMANEVYLMSLMAIDPDNQAEKKYLEHLASSLNIDDSVVAKIHSELGIA